MAAYGGHRCCLSGYQAGNGSLGIRQRRTIIRFAGAACGDRGRSLFHRQRACSFGDIGKAQRHIIAGAVQNRIGSNDVLTAPGVFLAAGNDRCDGEPGRQAGSGDSVRCQRRAVISLAGRCRRQCDGSIVHRDFQHAQVLGKGIIILIGGSPVNRIGIDRATLLRLAAGGGNRRGLPAHQAGDGCICFRQGCSVIRFAGAAGLYCRRCLFHRQRAGNESYIRKARRYIIAGGVSDHITVIHSVSAAAGIRLAAGGCGGQGKAFRQAGNGHRAVRQGSAVIGLAGGCRSQSHPGGIIRDRQPAQGFGNGIIFLSGRSPFDGISVV